MRLQPRTKLGSWAAAAAVWVGCSAVAWEQMPFIPRAEWGDIPAGVGIHEVCGPGPTVTTATYYPDRRTTPGQWPPAVDGPVHLWDASTGQSRELPLSGVNVPDHRFSPDGAWQVAREPGRLVVAPVGGGAATGLPVKLSDPIRQFIGVAFSPDSRLLVYRDEADGRRVLRLFDLTDGHPVRLLPDADFPVTFSADGQSLAYHSAAHEWVVADVGSGAARFRCPARDSATVHLSRAGDRFAKLYAADRRLGRAVIWDTASGERLCDVPFGHYAAVPGDGRRLITVDDSTFGRDQVVTVRDSNGGAVLGRVTVAGVWVAYGRVVATEDGQVVAEAAGHKAMAEVREWLRQTMPWLGVERAARRMVMVDVLTGHVTADLPTYLVGAVFAPDGRSVAVLAKGMLQVFDLPPRKSVAWSLVISAALALPPAWWARRRSRRLTAATP